MSVLRTIALVVALGPVAGDAVSDDMTRFYDPGTGKEVLRVGGCLTGPLVILDAKGRTTFQLGAGVSYGPTCGARR